MGKNYSKQTTLTENSPFILDSTCSELKIYPKFASIRLDKRIEAKPDIVADDRFLPFKDGVFDMIYCDPPHNIRHSDKGYSGTWKTARKRFAQYGFWRRRSDWVTFVYLTNKEFARCLKKKGSLHYKISYNAKSKEMIWREDMGGYCNFEVVKEIVKDPTISWSKAKMSLIEMRKLEK